MEKLNLIRLADVKEYIGLLYREEITISKFAAILNDCANKALFKKKKRVILESPYAGNLERNINYARMCVRDSLHRGEAPIASHLLYTQEGILDDNIESERSLGIDAGLAWKEVADKHVFYVDYGYSKGMLYAKEYATTNNIEIEERKILK